MYNKDMVLTKTGAGCPDYANKTKERTLKEKRAMADFLHPRGVFFIQPPHLPKSHSRLIR